MHVIALSPFDAAAILVVLTASLAYINHRLIGLPTSIAMTVMGAVASLIVIAIDFALPASNLSDLVASFLAGIDFETTLMDGMLSFLLFAGALHVDWGSMQKGRWPILVLKVLQTAPVTVSRAIFDGFVSPQNFFQRTASATGEGEGAALGSAYPASCLSLCEAVCPSGHISKFENCGPWLCPPGKRPLAPKRSIYSELFQFSRA